MAINFNKAEFVLSAVRAETFIRDGKPQVTFAGRSNVGKSSVINRLLGRKNFARVGATPGKTSQINYFDIDGKLYFTDLPGYGYAKVSKEERDRWGRLMERYFAEEGLITLGVLIVDARHKPTVDDVKRFRNYVNSTSSSKGAVYMWCDTYDHRGGQQAGQAEKERDRAKSDPDPPDTDPAGGGAADPLFRREGHRQNGAPGSHQRDMRQIKQNLRLSRRFCTLRGGGGEIVSVTFADVRTPPAWRRPAPSPHPASGRRQRFAQQQHGEKHGAPCTAANAVEYHHAVQAEQQQGREVFHIWVSCVP